MIRIGHSKTGKAVQNRKRVFENRKGKIGVENDAYTLNFSYTEQNTRGKKWLTERWQN